MSYSKVVIKNQNGEVVVTYTGVTNYVPHDTFVTLHGHEEGGAEGAQDFTRYLGTGWSVQCFE